MASIESLELDTRGTEADVIGDYLTGLGGVQTASGCYAGEGWEAVLTVGEHRFSKWVFPRVIIRFDGDPERVRAVHDRMRLLAFRGGG